MALALIVLAIGSVAAGWIGIPHAIGGHNELGAWLEPSFSAPRVAGEAAVSEAAAEAGEAAEAEHAALELTLMGVSLTIAVAGIAFAYFVWIKRRRIADNVVREFPGLHRLLLNKYYVDELYDATIVQPIKAASTEGLWRWFDVRVIDGAVNGDRVNRGRQRRRVAASAVGLGARLRRIAVRRCGHDPGLLPMAMNQRQLPNLQLPTPNAIGTAWELVVGNWELIREC